MGQVRVLLKGMENLENWSSKVPIALDTLVVSSPVTVQGGRTEIYGQIAPVFQEYIAPHPQPAAHYATPVLKPFAAPAPVVERISPDFTVYAVPAPVVEPSLVGYVAAQLLSWKMFPQILQCVPHLFLWWSTSLQQQR